MAYKYNTDIEYSVYFRDKTLVIGYQFAKFTMFTPINVYFVKCKNAWQLVQEFS